MKQATLIEVTIPVRAEAIPTIREDGTYELLWGWGESYVRLLFEKADLVHEAYGKIIGLETALRQAQKTDGKAS